MKEEALKTDCTRADSNSDQPHPEAGSLPARPPCHCNQLPNDSPMYNRRTAVVYAGIFLTVGSATVVNQPKGMGPFWEDTVATGT